AWAMDADAFEPTQDFDLALAWVPGLERTYVELAADIACPKRTFFVEVLYLMVGDPVRCGFRNVARPIVESLIEMGDAVDHPDIRRWQERSRRLLEHPGEFDYEQWCAGGLARE